MSLTVFPVHTVSKDLHHVLIRSCGSRTKVAEVLDILLNLLETIAYGIGLQCNFEDLAQESVLCNVHNVWLETHRIAHTRLVKQVVDRHNRQSWSRLGPTSGNS